MGWRVCTVAGIAAAFGALAPGAQAAIDFNAPVGYTADGPREIARGDFDADGILDLVAVGDSTNATVLIGVGDGTFRAGPPQAVDTPVTGVTTARLNPDGRSDLITAEGPPGNAINRYLSEGAPGAFGPKGDYPIGEPLDVATGDIDGDGDIDVAIARDAGVSFYLGDGAGGLALSPSSIVLGAGEDATAIAIGDLDPDGDNDLAVGTTTRVIAGMNNGAGSFTPAETNIATPSSAVAIADVDRNGREDIVAVRDALGDLAVARSTSDGFAASPQPAGGNASSVDAADLDADDIPDLVVSNSDGEITALVGRGDGSFTPTSGFAAGGNPSDVVVGDFNRDGNPDAATASEATDRVVVFLARGPQLSLTPANIDFGNQRPGTTSEPRTFRLTNNGPPRAKITDVTISGASEFSVLSNTCNGADLGIGQSCEVAVRFAPAAEGRREGRLTVTTRNAGGPLPVGLAGNGAITTSRPGACANDLNGTPGAETLTGTELGDNIFGFGGSDVLNGLGGADCLVGAGGNDRLNGGEGADVLDGGRGNDVEDGGNGNDRLSGASGRDKMSGGRGRDSLNGGSSADVLSGGAGNDRLTGSTGNDRLAGGSGKNTYSGGPGRDNITAANGRVERIDCGTGRDKVRADRKDKLRRCERVRRVRR